MEICINGQNNHSLAEELSQEAAKRMAQHGYSQADIDYIKNLKLRLVELGQDVELKPAEITSHRPLIGPFIVAVKKMIFPFVSALLKESFKQQRDFNAAAVSMIADLLKRQGADTGNIRPEIPKQ